MMPKLMTIAISGLALIALAFPAEAQRSRRGDQNGLVKTCSYYGHGCTSAPIRRAQYGYEFRMPGGTWISCRADCKNAIREEMLDFWETQQERAGDSFR